MKWSGNADQVLRKIGEDAPVVSFIGVRQGRAGNPTTESHVVEFAAHRSQARLDVAETLAVSELSEGHRQILVPARQTSVVLIAVNPVSSRISKEGERMGEVCEAVGTVILNHQVRVFGAGYAL